MAADSTQASLRATVFIRPDGARVTLVLLDTDVQAHTVAVESEGFAALASSAFRTSDDQVEQTAELAGGLQDGAVTRPARSVVTVVLEGG